jgi:hypothetical protein
MKARFLQSILVEDGIHRMSIELGEELTATDRGDFYELRKRDGRGTMAPKEAEGTIYEIVEDRE